MRTLTFVAVAIMSIWFATEANAQKPPKQTQEAQGDTQIDGEKGKQGRRGRRSRGQGQQSEGQGKRQARGGQQMMDMLFTRFDADKNGSISLAEAPERMKQRFEKLDTNSDKSVSKEELQASFAKVAGEQSKGKKGAKGEGGKGKDGAGRGKKGEGKNGQRQMMDPAKMIEKVDANKDGSISLDEAPERMKKRFDRIDTDSSGTITADELKASFEQMKKKGGKDKAIGRNKSANPDDKLPKQPKRPPMAEEGA